MSIKRAKLTIQANPALQARAAEIAAARRRLQIATEDMKVRAARNAIWGALQCRFPKAFPSGRRPPLAYGIREEIIRQCPDLDPVRVAQFLRWYCSGFSYLKNITQRRRRRGLDGVTVADITDKEVAVAHELLKQFVPTAGVLKANGMTLGKSNGSIP
jgi:hypothetical protein